jgi:hypothetical protein
MPLIPATLDKLLYQIQMMLDLAAGKTELNYQVADGGLMKDYRFAVQADKESLKVPFGNFETIVVTRLSDDRITTFWCAADLDYLPVKIAHGKKKEKPVTAMLTAVTGLPNNINIANSQ